MNASNVKFHQVKYPAGQMGEHLGHVGRLLRPGRGIQSWCFGVDCFSADFRQSGFASSKIRVKHLGDDLNKNALAGCPGHRRAQSVKGQNIQKTA